MLPGDRAFQSIAKEMAARLEYHGSTGPMPAYIWNDVDEWNANVNQMCLASVATGFLEPLDASAGLVDLK